MQKSISRRILRSKNFRKHTVASAGTISFHEGEHLINVLPKIAKEHGVDISHQKS